MPARRRIGADRRVRLGVAGLGAVAQAVHLPLLDRLPDRFAVAAVCDLSARLTGQVGERYRVPPAARFGSLEAMLDAGGLDALLVLTSGSHGAAAAAGLARGLPVLSEKPLAWTLAEVDAVRSAAGPDGRLLLGYMKLFDPAVVRGLEVAAAWRERGAALRSVEVVVLHPTSEAQLAHARLLPPAGDVGPAVRRRLAAEEEALRAAALGEAARELGLLYSGIVLGSIVHDLAILRAFAGDPVGIDHVDTWPAEAWPPSVAVDGRLGGDARLSIRWHFLEGYPAYREEVRLHFDRGSIELVFPSPYLLHTATILTVAEPDGGARRRTRFDSVAEAFEEELLAFHGLVVDGRPPRAGIEDGRADVVTCQAIVARLAAIRGIRIGGEAGAAARTAQ